MIRVSLMGLDEQLVQTGTNSKVGATYEEAIEEAHKGFGSETRQFEVISVSTNEEDKELEVAVTEAGKDGVQYVRGSVMTPSDIRQHLKAEGRDGDRIGAINIVGAKEVPRELAREDKAPELDLDDGLDR